MDPKNLAVLMQLKAAMGSKKEQDDLPTGKAAEAAIQTLDGLAKAWSKGGNSSDPTKKTVWVEKTCRFCKSTFHARADWKPQPIMCKGCRTERKTHYDVPDGDTLYTETKVFHGGGPGTGRRK